MDLILINGKIITMDETNPQAEAVAILNNRIHNVDSNQNILALKDENTKVIDLQGKFLVPGFNDSHMHLLGYGFSSQNVDLTDVKSIEELISETGLFIKTHNTAKHKWIQGRGWNHNLFPNNVLPTRYDLDNISTDHPIILNRVCGHISVANSKALELAGILDNIPFINGGVIDVDKDGIPTGILRENAMKLIKELIPEPSIEEIKEMILFAAEKALEHGITSVQTDDFVVLPNNFEKVLTAFHELNYEGKLPIRVNEQCLLPDKDKLQKFLDLGYKTGIGDDFFKIGPLKILSDGSLGARTAYLKEPYFDETSTRGIAVYSQEELDELILLAHRNNMQLAVHAIGDLAIDMVLNSIEKAQKRFFREDPRHSIIHCQVADNSLIERFKELNVIAHIQPLFLVTDMHFVEKRLGGERAKLSYQWKSMFNLGINVACGSDAPVASLSVIHGVYAAVTRKDLDGYPEDGWLSEQKLTVAEALYGYTLGAAYASFEEKIKGSITPGKLADIAVLSDNLYEIDPDDIKHVKVEMTFVNGKMVYQRK